MDITDPVTGEGIDLQAENIGGLFTNLTLLRVLLLSVTKDRPFPLTQNTFKDEYDYVIIGGGTAGSVMANRLSQKPCVSVLLLEGGGRASYVSEVPALSRVSYETRIDCLYKTVPQKHCCSGQVDSRVKWNSGCVLGGGSVLNAMLYVRGNEKNYDDWEAEGCTGWGYKGVLPHFKDLEDNRNIDELDQGFHSTGGPMTMEKPNYTPEIKNPLIRAMERMGYELRDSNGRKQRGIYDLQGTLRDGKRCSTAKAYLVPAEDRPNLDILKNAYATKILITDKKAWGVEFDHGGRRHTVKAKMEVIVSPGTVKTAQLLMLSGIGPREHLEEMNIPVVANLPVGQGMQDHPDVYMTYTVNKSITPVIVKYLKPSNILQYTIDQTGPLNAPNQVTLLAFVDGENATSPEVDDPYIQLYFAEYTATDARLYNLKPEVFAQVYSPYIGSASYLCIVSHLQPRSRGEIKLNSLDPYDDPLIDPEYFKDDRDLRDVVAGMKLCNRIAESPEMKEVQAKVYETPYPGCEEFVGDEDRYLPCQARAAVLTSWHPVGTARMGQPNDPRSVVDPQLRVIGVSNIRIVNAAIMPIIPSANTNVPTMMVAEKAYDMMKNDVNCSTEVKPVICTPLGVCV